MKVQYTKSVQLFVAAARKHLKQTGVTYGEKPKGKKELAWVLLPYSVKQAVGSEMSKAEEIETYRIALGDRFGFYFYCNTTAEFDGLKVTFHSDKNFKTREAMLEWADKHEVKIPVECKKEGVIVGGSIHTSVKHVIQVDEDVKITVNYTREGSPTPHCRVETYTDTRVICELQRD